MSRVFRRRVEGEDAFKGVSSQSGPKSWILKPTCAPTSGVGGLSKRAVSRLISALKGVLIGVMILISLQHSHLLSPPTLQVWSPCPRRGPTCSSMLQPIIGPRLMPLGLRVLGLMPLGILGFRVLGCRVFGLRVFRVLGFRVLGFRVLGIFVHSLSSQT